jgi:hypothetical protein
VYPWIEAGTSRVVRSTIFPGMPAQTFMPIPTVDFLYKALMYWFVDFNRDDFEIELLEQAAKENDVTPAITQSVKKRSFDVIVFLFC